MKLQFVDRVQEGDALSRVRSDPNERHKYSEWHHFNLNDDANGVYAIFNLALSGNIRDADQARVGVSLVVYERGRGWRGSMNLYPLEDTRFAADTIDLTIGTNSVKYRKDRYVVSGALKDGSVVLNATWTPETSALRVDSIGGVVNTFILPRLRVNGTLCVRGRKYHIEKATGYHDHNWGYWNWGEALSWNWGYIIQAPSARTNGQPPVSLVFGQVTNGANGRTKSDFALAVWDGDRCAQIFLDDAVRITTAGMLTGVTVPRVPGVMAFLEPGQGVAIPRHVNIQARDGDDWIEIDMDVNGAMQFLVPRSLGVGSTTISELVGEYSVRTMLRGYSREFSYNGFAEIAR